MQQKSIKQLVFLAILLILSGILIVFILRINLSSNNNSSTAMDLSITPTPCALPTKAYRSSSVFQAIIRQLFNRGNQGVEPQQILEDGKQLAENPYMNLFIEDDFCPVDIDWWQAESSAVYEYIEKRFDAVLSEKVIVTFKPAQPGNCAPRGATFHEQQSIIVIYADENTNKKQILATLAHELGHVFIHKAHENLSDVALNEGLATWAAGDYWAAWKGFDFDNGVNDFIRKGTYLSIFSNYDLKPAYDNNSPDCIMNRDILLTELASFIDFLYQNYGADKVDELLDMEQTGMIEDQRIINPPNYNDVFGLELNQLEYLWLENLVQPDQQAN